MQFKDIYGQEAVKERLLKSVREGRIPHAQLICGPQGTQKLALALAFAQYVNCKNRTETDSCGICPSCKKISALIHPDLHFAYPIVKKGDKDTTCSEYAAEWREMVTKHSPFTLSQWLDFIGAENKQAVIYANESEEINNTLSQKAYEGGYKTMVIWLPEKMHVVCANKLLKTIEEPLGKTLFLLVSNNAEEVLGTILSRTQRIPVAPLCEEDIRHFLQDRHPNLDQQTVSDAAHLGNGSLTDAEGSLTGSSDNREYLELFKKVMRASYARNAKQMKEWTEEISGIGRKRHISFLEYAQRMIRESFISNLKNPALNYMTKEESEFVSKFGPFVNERNIAGLTRELQLAQRDIEQNTQAKLVFFDLALKMTMLIKQ
ncbi:MAG: DNA polymerase III subunit delta [Paludibacteraceae bacterium]|nr:DNA polymerase III subunit delta [Paludibacteraceae bacterium]